MSDYTVSIVSYTQPKSSVRQAVDLCDGLRRLPAGARVFIKPNIVFWTRATDFPKWGVITTSRVVEDMVGLLKENGIDHITIGEGTVLMDPKDTETPAHAHTSLGYETLKKRYGIDVINIFERPFETVDLGDGVRLNFNQDVLNSDFVVNLPVMKTHNQTVVSLGIKNLKGLIDMASRKKCHSADPQKDLNFMIARLADQMPPMLTVVDGIFTSERGPSFDGKIRRSNLLVASSDVLAADLVAAKVLGYDASEVPHLVHAAGNCGRPLDLSDITVAGEPIIDVASRHEHDFLYSEDSERCVPVPMARQGIKGLFYRKYDLSLCTYCSGLNGVALSAIRSAWTGEPWDDVEILTGKMMTPTPGKKKTVLIGKCMYKANKDHPDIQEMLAVKGCPPDPKQVVEVLHRAGIPVDPGFFENMDQLPGFFLERYKGKPEFDENLFKVA